MSFLAGSKVCQTVVLHHNTTSPTTLLGCWAKFRTGLPPYRSGLLDGKCVWRLSLCVSLTPLCIACLDLTSTTSGRTMWPRGAVTGLHRPHIRAAFIPSSSINSCPLFQPIIRKGNWGKVTEVEPGANKTWPHQSQVQPCECQFALECLSPPYSM